MANGFFQNLSTEEQNEVLRYAFENDIKDLQHAFSEMRMNRVQSKLSDLTYKVNIWPGTDKTKRWRAKYYLGDKERKIAGKMHGTREDIENTIYEEIKAYEAGLMVTFKQAYEAYIEELRKCESDSENIVRIERTYDSYYTEWADTPVKDITVKKIKDFFLDKLTEKKDKPAEKKMTLSEFNKVYSIMLHSLLKAKDMEYIDWSISNELADIKKNDKEKKEFIP